MFKHFGLDPDKEVKFLATGGMESRLTRHEARIDRSHFRLAPHQSFLARRWGLLCWREPTNFSVTLSAV